MRLELQHHYPLGLRSVLGLSLALGGEILDVHGVVMYLQIVDEQRCAVGIQFKDLSEDGRRMIQRFIDSDPKQLPGLKPQPPRPLEEKT
jgi:hypothetical protein